MFPLAISSLYGRALGWETFFSKVQSMSIGGLISLPHFGGEMVLGLYLV